MSAGRPFKFESPEEMQEAVDEYFMQCKEEDDYATYSGLAYALGVTTQTLRNYGKREGFEHVFDDARQRIEIEIEKMLLYGKNQTGAIFNLKNNFGWKDTQHVEEKSQRIVEVKRTIVDPKKTDTESSDS